MGSVGTLVERSYKGEAISARGLSPSSRKKLRKFIAECERSNRLDEWRRGRGVLGYIEGRSAAEMAVELGVSRVTVGRWLQWYEADGLRGLVTVKAPGRPRHLNDEQRAEIATIIDAGPQEAGFASGVWTGRAREVARPHDAELRTKSDGLRRRMS